MESTKSYEPSYSCCQKVSCSATRDDNLCREISNSR